MEMKIFPKKPVARVDATTPTKQEAGKLPAKSDSATFGELCRVFRYPSSLFPPGFMPVGKHADTSNWKARPRKVALSH
jgi:hypothetical protein